MSTAMCAWCAMLRVCFVKGHLWRSGLLCARHVFYRWPTSLSCLSLATSPALYILFLIFRQSLAELPRLASFLWSSCFSLLSNWDYCATVSGFVSLFVFYLFFIYRIGDWTQGSNSVFLLLKHILLGYTLGVEFVMPVPSTWFKILSFLCWSLNEIYKHLLFLVTLLPCSLPQMLNLFHASVSYFLCFIVICFCYLFFVFSASGQNCEAHTLPLSYTPSPQLWFLLHRSGYMKKLFFAVLKREEECFLCQMLKLGLVVHEKQEYQSKHKADLGDLPSPC